MHPTIYARILSTQKIPQTSTAAKGTSPTSFAASAENPMKNDLRIKAKVVG